MVLTYLHYSLPIYSNICLCFEFKVQSKVNMKYDTWHKEILSKFASRLGDNMQDFYGSVSKVHA